MQPTEVRRAVEAARSIATTLGLHVDAAVVVSNTDRVAARLMPCDVLARVAPSAWEAGQRFEADVARLLAGTESPVGELEPRAGARVYVRDAFAITLWRYHERPPSRGQTHVDISATIEAFTSSHIAPAEYADALVRLHAGLRQIDLAAPHVTARIAGWQRNLGDREVTPELRDADRELLHGTLDRVAKAIVAAETDEQLLHGEPHPGNVLDTTSGPLFIDLGTCQRGPIEYDLSYAPEEVGDLYPGVNQELVRECRILMWAGITSTRWCRDDQMPNREYWRTEGLNQLRAALARNGRD